MTDRAMRLSGRLDAGCAAIAFLAPLAVYLWTMAPTVYGLDSAELTTAAHVLGIAHSPGAPTYMLLGHLMSKIPIGDVGYRLNLLSALSGAATVLATYRIARELRLTIQASLIASGLLAFSFYFWAWSLVAELYAPHAFFASVVLLCIVRWRNTSQARLLFYAAFLLGLGCGNHTALVLLTPGYAWLVLSAAPRLLRRPAFSMAVLASTATGLLVFAYLPIRQAAGPEFDYVSRYFPEVDLGSTSGLLWMVRGGMFEPLFFAQRPAMLPREGIRFAHVLLSNFTPLGVGVAILGCCSLFRSFRSVGVGLVLLFAFHSAFFLTYGAPDRFWMLSVSYVIMSVWIAAGVDSSERLLRRYSPRCPPSVGITVAALCVPVLLIVNWPRLDLRNDRSARDYGVSLGSRMEKGSVFFGLWEQIPILEYLQIVEGWRTDVELHNAVFLDAESVCSIVKEKLSDNRPVYTSRSDMIPCTGVSCQAIVSNNLYLVTLSEGG